MAQRWTGTADGLQNIIFFGFYLFSFGSISKIPDYFLASLAALSIWEWGHVLTCVCSLFESMSIAF